MKKIKIAILDSGVKTDHSLFKDYSFSGINLDNSSNIYDTYGHGTAIFNIIKNINNICDIFIFKLNNIENGVGEDALISALDNIYQNYKFDIINLSLGINISEKINILYDLCEKLSKNGSIIISAFDNSGAISYPAAFDNVIGVIASENCKKVTDFEYIYDDVVNIAAKGNTQKVAWSNPEYILASGNSFACAHVTVQAAKFMVDGAKTRKDILDMFSKISIREYSVITNHIKKDSLFKIEKAALFPFNKEMHSLVRYSNLLSFKITDIYDVKYSLTVGATTSHLMKDSRVKEYKIKNIDKINWDSFDTLILGHLGELSNIIDKSNLSRSLIKQAIEKNKKVYSFDDVSKFIKKEHQKNVFCPRIDESDLAPIRFGMLYRISKPILGVFGTSSKQGKFTLQLKLRELLIKQGYNVGQIGTEPSSLLYGMDYVFPMGYNSSVYIKDFDIIRYLNHAINDLCIKGKDIVIVGSQSGTVPFDTGNIIHFKINQYNFLMGTQPDAVVLCVNPYDEIDYINRTLKFIESSVNCKVIAIVIFPMDIKDDWTGIYGNKEPLKEENYLRISHALHSNFNIPVYKLGEDKDMDKLINDIIDYFSDENKCE